MSDKPETGVDELRELGKQLPWDRPDEARRDAVRSSLLVAATAARPQRSRWLAVAGGFAVGAIAAAAAVLLVVHRGASPSPVTAERARIDATSSADFERQITQTAVGVDEVVRVKSGKISVSIGELGAHEHVRVATGDAQLDGRGSYRVTVVDDALREVVVERGSATLKLVGHDAVFLATGQTWHATIATAEVVPSPTPDKNIAGMSPPEHIAGMSPPEHIAGTASPEHIAGTASPEHIADTASPERVVGGAGTANGAPKKQAGSTEPRPVPTPHVGVTEPHAGATEPHVVGTEPHAAGTEPHAVVIEPNPAVAIGDAPKLTGKTELERHFATGLALLKANKPAEAARELAAAVAADASDPLAADARYFQAIALTKAGRKTEAEAALVGFLDHAPTSLRRGRAAVMLARLIAERGDVTSARKWFESASADPDPAVVAAARAGVAALH